MTLGRGSAGKYGGLGYDRAFAGYQKLLRYVKGCSMLNNYFKKRLIYSMIEIKTGRHN